MVIARNLARDQPASPFVHLTVQRSTNCPRISKMSCPNGVKQMSVAKKRKVARKAKEKASAPLAKVLETPIILQRSGRA